MDTSESNDEKVKVDFMIGQSIGNSGLRKNEWIFEFEWLTKDVVLIYRDDLDHYKANANVYKGRDKYFS